MINQQAVQTLDIHSTKYPMLGEHIDRIRVTYRER